MFCSWWYKGLVLSLLAFIVLSESSRLPKAVWEQMLPKYIPSPPSAPSRGSNSVSASHSTTLKVDRHLPSKKVKEPKPDKMPYNSVSSTLRTCPSMALNFGVVFPYGLHYGESLFWAFVFSWLGLDCLCGVFFLGMFGSTNGPTSRWVRVRS
ncbi:hypothetical protein IFM89_018175 [Coptis chinensis]|uniref:Uncharacterized protein n=1 Tax=Coptis chinensis TaxID=261450 RepID=A0A835LYI7_9MAGN|nr:hypothetical protein IFM89_018175 [Coptis chinensis]